MSASTVLMGTHNRGVNHRVYLFKTKGSIKVNNNTIKYNGRRLRRAAVYLMGNNHQVIDNIISHQIGPGIVVAGYPHSDGNIIENNRFAQLKGLSIDVTYSHTNLTV